MSINENQTREACADPMLFATDIADYLVKKDVPFREAHHIVGELTAHAIEKNTPFPEIEIAKYKEFSDQFDESVLDLFDVKSALNARSAIGAPSPKNISKQISKWENKLSSE
jgi:argininosuccinate lyase